jgi:hypothetical protein
MVVMLVVVERVGAALLVEAIVVSKERARE